MMFMKVIVMIIGEIDYDIMLVNNLDVKNLDNGVVLVLYGEFFFVFMGIFIFVMFIIFMNFLVSNGIYDEF